MVTNTKSASKSLTILATVFGLIPEFAQGLSELAGTGVFGPQTTAVIHSIGAVLAVFGRIRTNTTIGSIF